MDKSIKIPDNLSHLKVEDRGYPVPFFVPIVEGKPNFKYASQKKQEICIAQSLCHICGNKLIKGSYFFITGPMGLENRTVTDPAMHKSCAEFALAVCPHMLYKKAERKVINEEHFDLHAKNKPDELFLIKADKYESKYYPEYKHRLVHFRVVSTEKYIYINNKLQKA
jgi:hypothetical protein